MSDSDEEDSDCNAYGFSCGGAHGLEALVLLQLWRGAHVVLEGETVVGESVCLHALLLLLTLFYLNVF